MKRTRNFRFALLVSIGAALVVGLSGAAPADEPPSITQQVHSMQIQALQQEMLSDPNLLVQVLALQETGLVQEILSDPELMAKIGAGDLSALQGDPRIERLAADPVVKAIASDLDR